MLEGEITVVLCCLHLASLKVSAPYHRVVGLPPAAPEGQPYCFTVECEEAKDNETENANDTYKNPVHKFL